MTLQNKVQQFTQDADKINAVVHGPAAGPDSLVVTDGGPVRTVARLIADKDAEINVAAGGVLALAIAAKNTAEAARWVLIYTEAPIDPPLYQLYMIVPPPDLTLPVMTAFNATSGTASPIAITSFTATDNVAVTGYWIGESATVPGLGAPGWTPTAPTTYSTATVGAATLYARVRDAAGNISTALTKALTVLAPAATTYDVGWPYDAAVHMSKFSIAGGSYTNESAIPLKPASNITIKSVAVPMSRDVTDAPGTCQIKMEVRSGSTTGTLLSTVTLATFSDMVVTPRVFTLPSNLTLSSATTYFFVFIAVSPTGGNALYRVWAQPSTGKVWSRYDSGTWTEYTFQSAIRLNLA